MVPGIAQIVIVAVMADSLRGIAGLMAGCEEQHPVNRNCVSN